MADPLVILLKGLCFDRVLPAVGLGSITLVLGSTLPFLPLPATLACLWNWFQLATIVVQYVLENGQNSTLLGFISLFTTSPGSTFLSIDVLFLNILMYLHMLSVLKRTPSPVPQERVGLLYLVMPLIVGLPSFWYWHFLYLVLDVAHRNSPSYKVPKWQQDLLAWTEAIAFLLLIPAALAFLKSAPLDQLPVSLGSYWGLIEGRTGWSRLVPLPDVTASLVPRWLQYEYTIGAAMLLFYALPRIALPGRLFLTWSLRLLLVITSSFSLSLGLSLFLALLQLFPLTSDRIPTRPETRYGLK